MEVVQRALDPGVDVDGNVLGTSAAAASAAFGLAGMSLSW